MTNLTNTINKISAVLELGVMDLHDSINMHNMLNEHDQIETEDEVRKHLLEIAFNSRMMSGGKDKYSRVCELNDNYFKAKLAA